MTLDHIQKELKSTEAFELYRFSNIGWPLGRIAAPLFLFLIAESSRHTHDRKRFILRLYIAAICTGLFNCLANVLYSKLFDRVIDNNNNIFFTYLFTVTYIYIIESFINSLRERDTRKILKNISLFAATFLPTVIYIILFSTIRSPLASLAKDRFTALTAIDTLLETLFPSPFMVEYSIFFVIMGVCLYFARTKYKQCAVFVGFCVLCYLTGKFNIGIFQSFYGIGNQHYMILALLFILLYNGERGKEHKTFFYIYYPLHYRLLVALSAFLNAFFA